MDAPAYCLTRGLLADVLGDTILATVKVLAAWKLRAIFSSPPPNPQHPTILSHEHANNVTKIQCGTIEIHSLRTAFCLPPHPPPFAAITPPAFALAVATAMAGVQGGPSEATRVMLTLAPGHEVSASGCARVLKCEGRSLRGSRLPVAAAS